MTLVRRRIAGFVKVERLVLEVPGVQFPFDVSGGAGRFQHRRCTLRHLEVLVEAEAFSSFYASLPQLVSFGFPFMELCWQDGEVHLESEARLGDRRVPFLARLRALAEPDGWVRLELGRWQILGYLPVPPPLLGVGLLAVAGVRPAAEPCSSTGAPGRVPEDGSGGMDLSAGNVSSAGSPSQGVRHWGRSEAVPPWSSPTVIMEGTGAVRVDCLGLLLRELLPAYGWRLPRRDDVVLQSLALRPDGLHLVYVAKEDQVGWSTLVAGPGEARREDPSEGATSDSTGGSPGESGLPPVARSMRWGPRPREFHRTAEHLLATGRVAEALHAFGAALEKDPRDVFARLRKMEILACSPRSIPEARRMARKLLVEATPETAIVFAEVDAPGGDDPGSAQRQGQGQAHHRAGAVEDQAPPASEAVQAETEQGTGSLAEAALLVLAATAEEIQEPVEAASRYAALASQAERQGDLRGAVLSTLACGRLLSVPEPEQAISWYERALGLDPQLAEAVNALTGLYRQQGRIPDLLRLLRRHLARVTDRRERLRGHLTLGRLYLSPLGDALRARAELERAVRLDDMSLAAWDGLAEAHRLAGNHDKERGALEKVVTLSAAQGDEEAVLRATLRMARAWAEAGDLHRALEVTGALLAERPADVEVLEMHGRTSAEAGRWDVAAQTLERLLSLDGLEPPRRAEVAAHLARIHLDGLGDPAGARIFVEASLGAEEREDALGLALRMADEEGRFVDLVDLVARLADAKAEKRNKAELEGRAEEVAALEAEEATLRLRQARVLWEELEDPEQAMEALGPLLRRVDKPASTVPAAGVREALHLQVTLLGESGRDEERQEAITRLGDWLFSGGVSLAEEEIALLCGHGEALARGEVAAELQAPVRRGVALRLLRRLHATVPQDPRPLMALTDLLDGPREQAEREGLLERLASLTERKGDGLRQAAALKELGELRRRQDRPGEALVALRAAALLVPGDGALQMMLGEVAYDLSEWDEAQEAFGAARRGTMSPADVARLAFRRGQLALRLGELDSAISLLREALVADPPPEGALAVACHQALLVGLSRLGCWKEAAAALEALAADTRAGQPPGAVNEARFAAAEIYRRQLGEAQTARRLYDAALKEDPDHLGALNGLTVLEVEEERWPQVAQLLERKLELLAGSSEVVPILEELAGLYATRLTRPQAARSAYERILEREPDHRQGLCFAAQDAFSCGDLEVARRYYARLLFLGPGEDEESPEVEEKERLSIHWALGRIALATGDMDGALRELAAVLALDSVDGEALSTIDGLYEAGERWEELAEVLRRRADQASSPRETVEHLLRLTAILEERLGKIPEAMAVCREVLRREPDCLPALTRQARLLGHWGAEPAERRQVLERLLALRRRAETREDEGGIPSRAELLLDLGLLLKNELGEPQAGARHLNEALAEGCDDARLHRVLADLAREEGRHEALDHALGRLAEVAEDPREKASAWLEQAEVRLNDLGDPAAALSALGEGSVGDWPDRAVALKARICEAAGEWEDAFGAYGILATRARERQDEEAEREVLEPMLTLAGGALEDFAAAKEVAERLLVIRHDHLGALAALAAVARRQRAAPDLVSSVGQWVGHLGDGVDDVALAASLLWEAGRLCVRMGDLPGAVSHATQALQRDPDHVEARLLLAESHVLAGAFQEAAEVLEDLTRRIGRQRPTEKERQAFLGALHGEVAELAARRLGDTEWACRAWRAGAPLLTGESLVIVLEAWARLAVDEGRWSEAAEVVERLRDQRGEPTDALSLAEIYERLGRVDDALRVLRDAPAPRTQSPGGEELALSLRERTRELLAAAGRFGELARTLEEDARRTEDPAKRRELLLEAAGHFMDRAGEGGRAERCLLGILGEEPLYGPAVMALVDRAEDGRRTAEVDEALTRAAQAAALALGQEEGEVWRDHLELLSRVAHHRLRGDQDDAAAQGWLEVVLAAMPGRVLDLQAHTAYLERVGRVVDLAARVDAALASSSLPIDQTSPLRLRSARIHVEALGDPAGALRVLTAEDPRCDLARQGEALALEAELLERLDRLEEAEGALLGLAQQSPEPEPLLDRAKALADRREDHAAAIRIAWRLAELAVTPETKGARLAELVARCEAASDQVGLARAQRALVATAADPEGRAARLLELGRTLISLQEWTEAQAALVAAMEVAPAAVPIHLELARVAGHGGDLDAARLALATAHDLLPEDAREERAKVSLLRSQLEVDLDGDRALARRYARLAAEETPRADRRAAALRLAASLASELEDPSQEEEALRALFDLGVADDLELARLAVLCETRDAWAEALVVYEHLRTRDPDEPLVRRKLAGALRATGQKDRAVEQLVAAAKAHVGRREGAAAAAAYAEAASLRLATDAGDKEARRLLELALASDSTSDAIFGQAARLCRQHQDDEGLLEVLRCRLPALDPAGQQAAYREMAQVALSRLGDPDRAAAFMALGLAAGGDEPSLLASLVVYHSDRGDWPVALDYGYRLDAVGGPPQEQASEVHQRLTDGALAVGDRTLARMHLRRALGASPSDGTLMGRLETLLVEESDHVGLVALLKERAAGEDGAERAASLSKAAALCEQHLGDLAAAETLLLEALEGFPGDEGARSSLIALLTRQERWPALFSQMEIAYQRARGPRRAELADALAELAEERLGDVIQAQNYRRLALGDAPADVRRLRALVDLLASQRKWSDLVEVVEEALDTMVLDADSAAGFYALLGRSFLEKLNRPDQALAVFERARARGGLTPRSGELLSELYESSGRFTDLAALLDELAERATEPAAGQRFLVKRARVLADHLGRASEAAALLLELFRIEPSRRRKLGAMARKLFVQSRLYQDAMCVLTEELEAAPEEEQAELWLERGMLLESPLGRRSEALACYQRVLEISPGYPPAHLRSALLLFESGERARSLEHAEAVIRSGDPSLMAPAHRLAGHLCVELDRIEEAVAHLEITLRHDPTDLEVVKELGHFYTASGHWDRLAHNMGRELALVVEPVARGRLWFRRALVYRDMLDRGGEALRCFREAVSADPSNGEAVAALRDFALERGDWETSLALMDRQLQMETEPTKRIHLLSRRADLLENRLGRMDEAMASVEEALGLQGGTDQALLGKLARLLVARQDWSRAAVVEETIAQRIEDPAARASALLRVADLHRRAEAPQAAIDTLKSVAKMAAGDALRLAAEGLVELADTPAERQSIATLLASRVEELPEAAPQRQTLLRLLLGLSHAIGDREAESRWADLLLLADPSDRVAFAHRRRRFEEEEDWPSLARLLAGRLEVASSDESLDLLTSLGCIQRERLRDREGAALTFDRLLLLRPDDLVALDSRADIAFLRGEFLEARELYTRMGNRQGSLDAGERAFRQGRIAEALGEEEEALRAYEQALDTRPGHLPALEALSRLYLLREMDAEALSPLTALVELVPPSDRALACGLQLARVRLRLGMHEEAEQGLILCSQQYPDQMSVLESLSEVQRKCGQWPGLADTLAALARQAGTPALRARRLYDEGQVRLDHLQDPEGAARRFLQAADLAPEDPLVVRRLAEHYAQVGRFAEARAAFLQLLELVATPSEAGGKSRASAAFGLAVTSLLCKGDAGREAPALIRQPPVEAVSDRDAAEILAAVNQGLHASGQGPTELRRVLDLLDSALGRAFLPRYAEAAERLLEERPVDLGLRRLLARLIARVGEPKLAALHEAAIAFLSPSSMEDGPQHEEGRRAIPGRSLAVYGPAVSEAAKVPLRSLLVGLHPHLGRLAPPIDPSVLGPEVEDMGSPELAVLCEELKVSLGVSPVGIVFARKARLHVEIVYSLPSVLLLDPELQGWPQVQVRFLLGRALEWVRSGSMLLGCLPTEPPGAVLDAVAQLFGVPLPRGTKADPAIVTRLEARGVSPDLFDNETMEALQVAFFNHYRAPVAPEAYLDAERHVANRIGLLVSGGLTESLEALARHLYRAGGAPGADEVGDAEGSGVPGDLPTSIAYRRQLVHAEPELEELLRFGTSTLYSQLRRHRSTLPRV